MIPGLLASILGFYPNASEAALHCKVHFAQRFWPSRLEPASVGKVEEAAGVPAPIIMEKMEAGAYLNKAFLCMMTFFSSRCDQHMSCKVWLATPSHLLAHRTPCHMHAGFRSAGQLPQQVFGKAFVEETTPKAGATRAERLKRLGGVARFPKMGGVLLRGC